VVVGLDLAIRCKSLLGTGLEEPNKHEAPLGHDEQEIPLEENEPNAHMKQDDDPEKTK
jgi:hypothetical protein